MNAIEKLAKKYHDPSLANAPHVNILYDDGELGFTKGGELLWVRSVHTNSVGLGQKFGRFPVERPSGHTCCYVTEENGKKIVTAMEAELKSNGVDLKERRWIVRQNALAKHIFRSRAVIVEKRMREFRSLLDQVLSGNGSRYDEDADQEIPVEVGDLPELLEGVISFAVEEFRRYEDFQFDLNFDE